MNYITLILIVAMVFGLSDFLTERVPALQKAVYVLAFTTIYVLFTIKYYYGPDILNYHNHYTVIGTISEVWHNPSEYTYEIGYSLLCALLNSWGVPLYGVTAIISTIYFIAIWLLFKQIPRKRSFALMLLVLFDYSLIFAAFRQCLAVSFFIFMIWCLQKRKYFWAVVWAVLSASMHKSGIFVVTLCLLAYPLHNLRVRPIVFQVLMLILGVMLLLPVSHIATGTLNILTAGTMSSLTHHLQLGKQIQSIWAVYAMLIVCIEYYLHYHKSHWNTLAIAALTGIALIAVSYQYYYLLNRVRSYFVPLIIVWVFQLIQEAEYQGTTIPYASLLKQSGCVLLFAFCIHTTIVFTQKAKELHAPIYDVCTLFDLRNGNIEAVKEKQLNRARLFWKEDFMQHENNML